MKKDKIKRIGLIAGAMILLSAFLVFGVNMGYKESLADFFAHSQAVIRLQDLEKGFIPQGLGYDEKTKIIYVTGYMDNGKKSPIYAFDKDTGDFKNKILMLTEKGDNFKGHAGGLSVYGDQIYIAGSTDACMYAFSTESILKAQMEESLPATACISLKKSEDFMRVSFTSVDEQFLYAGEFHKGLIFYTHPSHKLTAQGVTQSAYVMGFTLDEQNEAHPACVYSIPDNVQGACFADGYVYLSKSSGFFPGHILSYRLSDLMQEGTKSVLGEEVPLYILSEKNALKSTTIPPMCEEIVAVDGQMYILFEAASNRYIVGKKLGLDQVYAAPLSYFTVSR